MIREVMTIKQLETLQAIVSGAIEELHRLKSWTAAPEKMQETIQEYEQIKLALVTYTTDRRIIDEGKAKGDGERLRQGKETGEPVVERDGLRRPVVDCKTPGN